MSLTFTEFYILAFLIGFVSCGPSSKQDDIIKYRFLDSPYPGYDAYVDSEASTRNSLITRTLRPINVEVKGTSRNISHTDVQNIVLTWLAPLQKISNRVTKIVNVSEDISNPDIKVIFSKNSGATCGFTATPEVGPFTISLCPDSPPLSLLHEFGHGFGLGDTYHIGIGGCIKDQPESIMCTPGDGNLTQDDIEGISALFCLYHQDLCNKNGTATSDPGSDPMSGVDMQKWDQFAAQFMFYGAEKLKCSELYITNLSGDPTVRVRLAPSVEAPEVGKLKDATAISIVGAIAGSEITKVYDKDLANSGYIGSKKEPGTEYIWLKVSQPLQGWISKMYAECR